MRLITLKLKNFKGIRSFELQANGANVSIYGDNATGKTTIYDAFLWLLYGKDSQNKADFDIKTLDKDNKPIHGLEHEVEAVFDHAGKPLNLRKVFSEKWTKKRGSATADFTGHSTDYFVNDVPVKESEYKAKINEISNETIFKLLTSPTYYNTQLSWQDRRKILLSACGDIQDADVIAANESLKRLPDVLQGRTIEDHRKVIAARRIKINDELKDIPIRISEVQRSMPDISNLIPAELPADIQKYSDLIQVKQQELVAVKNGGEVAEKTKQLRQTEADLLKIENDFRVAIDVQLRNKRETVRQLESQRGDLRRDIFSFCDYTETISQLQKLVDKLTSDADGLRQKWTELHSKEFEFTQSETCPTCGQPLPVTQLQEVHEKALADFNLQRSSKLEEITNSGKAKMAEVQKIQEKIEELRVKEQRDNELRQAKEIELAGLDSKIDEINEDINQQYNTDAKETSSYQSKLREKESLEAAIREARLGISGATESIQKEIDELARGKESLEKALASVEYHKKGRERIETLKKQERDLAAEYERLEGELYMTEEFIRTKVNLLEEKINSRFRLARFKLFETQINGGLQEVCETLYNGVPYSSGLNAGHRIMIGLDIIRTLSEHYGFVAPIFIDNQESVTKIPVMDTQIISLIVSEPDKKLRIEYPETHILKEAV